MENLHRPNISYAAERKKTAMRAGDWELEIGKWKVGFG